MRETGRRGGGRCQRPLEKATAACLRSILTQSQGMHIMLLIFSKYRRRNFILRYRFAHIFFRTIALSACSTQIGPPIKACALETGMVAHAFVGRSTVCARADAWTHLQYEVFFFFRSKCCDSICRQCSRLRVNLLYGVSIAL